MSSMWVRNVRCPPSPFCQVAQRWRGLTPRLGGSCERAVSARNLGIKRISSDARISTQARSRSPLREFERRPRRVNRVPMNSSRSGVLALMALVAGVATLAMLVVSGLNARHPLKPPPTAASRK